MFFLLHFIFAKEIIVYLVAIPFLYYVHKATNHYSITIDFICFKICYPFLSMRCAYRTLLAISFISKKKYNKFYHFNEKIHEWSSIFNQNRQFAINRSNQKYLISLFVFDLVRHRENEKEKVSIPLRTRIHSFPPLIRYTYLSILIFVWL